MNAHVAASRSGRNLGDDLPRPHIDRPACHNGHMDEDLQRGLEALAAEYGLLAIYVFGSRSHEIAARAAGRPAIAEHPESDVDVGVEPRRGRTLSAQDRVRLMHRLETLLGAQRVDLVILPEANAFLAADVVRGELLLTTDLDAEAEVQLYCLRRAADLAPLLREQWRETAGGRERPVSPSKVRVATVVRKSSLVDEMLRGLATLPLTSLEAFQGDARDLAAEESYLRRALEALLDLGRHILAKGLGEGALEHKQIALSLRRAGVLDEACGAILFDMAGYRNRLTHFYNEVSTTELFDICAHRSSDIRRVRDALLDWLRRHPELVDGEL